MKYLLIFLALLAMTLSTGCSHSNVQNLSSEDKSCYLNPIDQLLFSYGLNKEEIEYRADGKGCFYTKDTDQEKINHIQEVEFGKSPPLSLRIYQGKNSDARLAKLFHKHDIKTYKLIFFGDKYLAWKTKDVGKVESLLDPSPGK